MLERIGIRGWIVAAKTWLTCPSIIAGRMKSLSIPEVEKLGLRALMGLSADDVLRRDHLGDAAVGIVQITRDDRLSGTYHYARGLELEFDSMRAEIALSAVLVSGSCKEHRMGTPACTTCNLCIGSCRSRQCHHRGEIGHWSDISRRTARHRNDCSALPRNAGSYSGTRPSRCTLPRSGTLHWPTECSSLQATVQAWQPIQRL